MANYNSLKNAALLTPSANSSLGSDTSRYENVFLSGNLNIGSTIATASSFIVPKISSVTYVGDDNAAAPAGGQTITVNGAGFLAGAAVYISGILVSSVSVVSVNLLTFVSPVKTAGNYTLIVVNTDGGSATFIPGIQYSGVPAWSTTAGTLATMYEADAISNTLVATSDSTVTYSVVTGSLPSGVTLNSSTGVLSGTAPSVGSPTTFNFTVASIDGENQDTNRNFNYAINPDVVSWSSPADGTTLSSTTGTVYSQLLSASSVAGKTISYSANALPAGLSITGSNIVGTPSAASAISSLITATAATTNKTATRTVNWSILATSPPTSVEYLIVAGGGSGGPVQDTNQYAGGGGAGGLLTGTTSVSVSTPYTITVGAGGTSSGIYSYNNGGDSSAFTITAKGGGSGMATNGGSGGGAGRYNGSIGRGIYPGSIYISGPRQGYDGGGQVGGGGGAGGEGQPNGTGGLGVTLSISGTATEYARGGSAYNGNPSAAPNTGKGGTGFENYGGGGTGNSGVVIIRYADTFSPASATTGSPTITTAGGYRVYKFTGSGSITF
jgi:hypothetical protein